MNIALEPGIGIFAIVSFIFGLLTFVSFVFEFRHHLNERSSKREVNRDYRRFTKPLVLIAALIYSLQLVWGRIEFSGTVPNTIRELSNKAESVATVSYRIFSDIASLLPW